MSPLKQLIHEIHSRSLWQVLLIYIGAGWIVFEIVQTVTEGLGLPQWFPAFAALLLLIGLPIVLATAFVKEGEPATTVSDPTLMPVLEAGSEAARRRRFLTWRNAGLSFMAALALWGVVATGWLLFRPGPSGQTDEAGEVVSPERIAILPFQLRGSGELEYLGEGMVNLLSISLDGAGDLRAVDARALLSFVNREGGGTLDLERGSRIAQHFGAGLYVMGDVLELPGGLRLDASLYDPERGREALAQGTVEGEVELLSELVDDLAAQLIGAYWREGGRAGGRLSTLASETTQSLPALKAYLEGELALRRRASGTPAAVEAFQRAVDADPSFALAWYRLSVASAWDEPTSSLPLEAVDQAARHSDRLAERDRKLVRAFGAFLRGRAGEAESLYREIVRAYPNDLEAWYQLGEVYFHFGPFLGLSIVRSRRGFERELAYGPQAGALGHLIRVAAREGNLSEVDSLLSQMISVFGPDCCPATNKLRAFASGDSAGQEEILATGQFIEYAASEVVRYLGDPLSGQRLLVQLIEVERSRGRNPVFPFTGQAVLELAMGRWRAAEAHLADAQRIDAVSAAAYGALLSTAPLVARRRAVLVEVREALDTLDVAIPSVMRLSHAASDDLRRGYLLPSSVTIKDDPDVKPYLLGLLSAHLGEYSEALRYASQLEQQGAPPQLGSLIQDLAQGVRALVLMRQGREVEALEALEQAPMEAWYGWRGNTAIRSRGRERFLHAELLFALARYEEALGWYESVAEDSFWDVIYLAPSRLRRAEIYERLGEPEKAAHNYIRFIELWSECDPEFRPVVEQAQSALARLTGEPVGP